MTNPCVSFVRLFVCACLYASVCVCVRKCPSTPWDDPNGWLGVKHPMTCPSLRGAHQSDSPHDRQHPRDNTPMTETHPTLNLQLHIKYYFSWFRPSLLWNSLPKDLRHCSTPSLFKIKLKTFLFSQYCMCCVLCCGMCVCVRACVCTVSCYVYK